MSSGQCQFSSGVRRAVAPGPSAATTVTGATFAFDGTPRDVEMVWPLALLLGADDAAARDAFLVLVENRGLYVWRPAAAPD